MPDKNYPREQAATAGVNCRTSPPSEGVHMHTTTTTLDVLFVTGATADSSAASDTLDSDADALSVSVATDIGDATAKLQRDPVDCVLCAESSDHDCLTLVKVLSSEFPSVPTVVFAGGADESLVTDLLGGGATDVIRSGPAETPAELVSTRVENVADAEGPAARTRTLERYETILNAAGDAIYQLDTEGTILTVNDAAVDLTGYDRTELVGEHVSKLLNESDIADAERLIRRQLERSDGSVDTLEMSVQSKDGETIPCETRIVVVGIGGGMDGSVGVARDITERREAKKQLEAERDMFARGPAVVFKWQNAGGWPVEYVSGNVTDLLGYTPEQLTSGEVSYADILHEEDIDRVTAEVDDHSDEATERFSHEPYRLVTSDGDSIWVKDTTTVVREGDEITHYLGYLVDITERKEREEDLQALKEEYELMVGTVGDVVYTLDENFEFMSVNGASEAITGYACEELEGEHISALLPESAVNRAREHRQQVIGGDIQTGTIEFEITRKDGSVCPVEFRYRKLPGEGFVGTAGVIRDITERTNREAKIASQRDELANLDRLNRIIRDIDQTLVGADTRAEIERAVCDRLTAAGRYGFALALRLRGTDTLVAHASTETGASFAENAFPVENLDPETSPELRALRENKVEVVQSVREEIDDEYRNDAISDAGVESLAAVPVTYQGAEYGVIVVYGEKEGTFSRREQAVLTELGETVGYAIAAAERRERERILTALYEATQDLLGADSETDVCDVVVETAAEVLGPPGIGIFMFDDERNVLEPAVATDELLSYYGDVTAFGPGRGDSAVWESYISGETRFYPDIRNADRIANPETDARSTLLIPLGDHGVFVAASTETDGFDERMRRLVGLLAATTEAALDRVAGRVGIRERDRQLAARAERLDRVEGVLDCLRDVNQLLIGAATRDEVESRICERLTEMEPYGFAWVGTVPPDGTVVQPRTWAGTEEGYLDAVSFDIDGTEPVATTAATGNRTVIENVTDHLRESAWASAAIDRGFESITAVPLVYGETTYGVLGLYATELDTFEAPVAGVLEELGRLIAYSINSVETTRGVLSEQLTELELRIETRDTFLNAVATVAGEAVSFREILPEEGGTARVLFALDDPPVDEVLAVREEFVAVEALSHIDATDEHIFRATLGGKTVAATLLRCGGLPREVVASAESTRVVVRTPQELDVRVYLDRIRETYPETTLVSRRTVDSEPTTPDINAALAANLTERQREVLLTAYRCGFFESPRETTGAELAGLLNISQPTLTHHLREAQRRLFEAIYEPTE